MDTTALQQTINSLESQKETLQGQLNDVQSQLDTANAQMNDAEIINGLEGLDEAGVAALATALASDPQNTSGITVSLPANPGTENA